MRSAGFVLLVGEAFLINGGTMKDSPAFLFLDLYLAKKKGNCRKFLIQIFILEEFFIRPMYFFINYVLSFKFAQLLKICCSISFE